MSLSYISIAISKQAIGGCMDAGKKGACAQVGIAGWQGALGSPPYILGELERCIPERGRSSSDVGGWREGGGNEFEGGGGGKPDVAGDEAGEALGQQTFTNRY